MQETLVGTAVVDGCKQRLLFVVVSGQQETVGCREEIALEDAIVLAELIYPRHVNAERPHHGGLAVHGLIQVGHQWRITVAAIEVLGIPLLALLESRCLAKSFFSQSYFSHRHRLGLQRTATINLIHIAQHHLQRGTVTNEVVNIQEEIEMLGILQQTDMEQTVLVDVERHDELLTVKRTVFNSQFSIFNS